MVEYCCTPNTQPLPCNQCRHNMTEQLGDIIFNSVFLFVLTTKPKGAMLGDFLFHVNKKNKDLDKFRERFNPSLPARYRQ